MKDIEDKMGGSMVYVMVLITFLGILSTGFLYMTEYSRRLVVNNHSYIEAQTTARLIHQSFCESVSSGTSEAMNTVWACFAEDCGVIWEEYAGLAGDEGDEEEEDGEFEEEEDGEWESFLRDRLADKAYVIKGSTNLPEQVSISITLTAFPLEGKATVSTSAACNGYRFSMMGDILFNDTDGDMMDLGEDVRICTQGTGVYRYYGGDTTRENPDTSPEAYRPRG